ncbi:MAG: hypothetical protein Q8P82_00990 [bacterium]|nr:hypothetical protein [bacterium]
MHKHLIAAWAIGLFLITSTACFAKSKTYIVLAAAEFVEVPAGKHSGIYPTFGAAFEFKLPHQLSLTPAILFEFSPELNRWGFIGALTLDRSIHDFVGVDIGLSIVQDQELNHWSNAAVFLGPYAGLSFFLLSATFSVGTGAFVDVRTGNWVLGPTLTLSIPISS